MTLTTLTLGNEKGKEEKKVELEVEEGSANPSGARTLTTVPVSFARDGDEVGEGTNGKTLKREMMDSRN
jgi:hypothetical protein